MFGEALAAVAILAFGVMLKKALQNKGMLQPETEPPDPSVRIVIDPEEGSKPVIPGNGGLVEDLEAASRRHDRDVIDAEDI